MAIMGAAECIPPTILRKIWNRGRLDKVLIHTQRALYVKNSTFNLWRNESKKPTFAVIYETSILTFQSTPLLSMYYFAPNVDLVVCL